MPNSRVGSGSPADKVLEQLRYGPHTVEDLAKSLRITDNAVRNQLRKLLESGLAIRAGMRPGISKPSALYAITLEGQIQFSTLYLPVLAQFLRVAEEQCPDDQLAVFLTDTGKALAKRYPRQRGSRAEVAQAAARLLTEFGGSAEVRKANGTITIRSRVCPLAALSAENLVVCHVLEGFLSEYLAASAEICCTRDEQPRCCFLISASP